MNPPPDLPAAFRTTVADLHAVAEHVLGPLRHLVEGHIGLRPTPQGFGTETLGDDRQVRVRGIQLIDFEDGREQRDDLTTIGDAWAFLRMPHDYWHDLYEPVTDGDPRRRLAVDNEASLALGDLLTFGAMVLTQVRNTAASDDRPSIVQLWPEHFDLAIQIGPEGRRCNVGLSPGDADHPEPYVYVGPHGARPDDPVWNEPFGASLGYAEMRAGADPVAFVQRARAVLAA